MSRAALRTTKLLQFNCQCILHEGASPITQEDPYAALHSKLRVQDEAVPCFEDTMGLVRRKRDDVWMLGSRIQTLESFADALAGRQLSSRNVLKSRSHRQALPAGALNYTRCVALHSCQELDNTVHMKTVCSTVCGIQRRNATESAACGSQSSSSRRPESITFLVGPDAAFLWQLLSKISLSKLL